MSDYRAYDRDRDYSPSRDYSPPRRHQSTRTIPRGPRDPDFLEETTYVERGKGPPPRDLIPRREESPEEIQRDFPPPASRSLRGYRDDYDDRRSSRPARSTYSRRDSYEDDYYDDSRSRRGGRSRRDDDDGYYSEDYERYDRRSRSRAGSRAGSRSPEKRKSGVEGLLEGLGLGGIAGAAAQKFRSRSQSRARARSRAGSERGGSRSPGREKHGSKSQRQWAQAAQAAIVAGAIEAFMARNEPGGIKGEKGKRILTAAIGAGGIDRLVDRNPDEKSKRHLAEAVIGGLAANRLANGPRSKSRGRGRSESRGPGERGRSQSIFDRFRSKSRGRSQSAVGSDRGEPKKDGHGLEKLAGGAAVLAAGKAIYDRVRSKSRGPDKDRRRSPSRSGSEDSYVPSRRRGRDVGPSSQRSRSLGPNDGAVVGPRGRSIGPEAGAVAAENGVAGSKKGGDDRSRSRSSSSSDTDLENRRKKMRGKELLTAGLASVATIHAAHNVYQGMKGSEKRHQLVAEGKMTVEEARKKRTKAWLQDAAAVGIAALGIKGAYSEWKEMNEQRHSVRELEQRRAARAKRREQRMRDARRASSRNRLPAPPDAYDDPPFGANGAGGGYASGLPPPPIPQNGYR